MNEDNEGEIKLESSGRERSRMNSDDKEDLFCWKNSSQDIICFIIYILDWSSLALLQYEDGVVPIKHVPTFLHYFAVIVTCGAPLMFLHTFVGQYAQTGYFVFGTMLPLAYGTGFLMAMYAFLKLTISVYYATFLLYYLFMSLYNVIPPWILCYKGTSYPIPCFSWHDFDLCMTMENSSESCFKPGTKVLAAIYFMRYLGLSGASEEKSLVIKTIEDKRAIVNGVFHGFLIFTMVATLSTRNFRNLDAIFRISFSLYIVGSLSLIMVGFTMPEALHGLEYMKSTITLDSLISIETWSATFRRLIEILKFADGGIVVFGSFIPTSDIAPNRSYHLTATFSLFALLFTIYVKIFEGILTTRLHLSMQQLMLDSEECIIFVLYPTLFGIQAYGNIFCFVFFLLLLLMNFCSMMLKVVVIERGLAYQFNISSYYSYSRFFIILGSYLVSLIFIPMSPQLYYNLLGRLKKFMVGIVLLQMVVVHLYGLQRFCDDVQFYHRNKVGRYMKTCWIIMPLYCIIEIFVHFVDVSTVPMDILITMVLLSAFVLPLLFGLLYIAVVLARDKNMMGLLRPMDKFGPRDIKLRIYRLLYNPRLSEKFMIMSTTCEHNCLYQSEALETAIREEIILIRKLMIELEKSQNLSPEETEIITKLRNHLKIFERNQRGIFQSLPAPSEV